MDDCIFCKIIAGDIPSTKVYEDDDVLAFMDISPAATGHTLLIPKQHVPYIWNASPEVAGRVGAMLPRLAGAVKTAVNADALNVFNLNGTAAGQTVFHIHFHIIPRHNDDGLLSMNSDGDGGIVFQLKPQPASREALEETAEKIRKALEAAASN